MFLKAPALFPFSWLNFSEDADAADKASDQDASWYLLCMEAVLWSRQSQIG
jgi:hypothetical protein